MVWVGPFELTVYVLRQGECSYLQRNWVCHIFRKNEVREMKVREMKVREIKMRERLI
jgi:hypothetical protein